MTKSKILRGLLIVVPALLLLLLSVFAVVLNTAGFKTFLLSEIRTQALEHAGISVEAGSLELHWVRLGIDLNDIVVYRSARPLASEPTLLRAARLEVEVRWLPLLRGRVELGKLILDRPTVRLKIDAQGRTNLPEVPNTGPSQGAAPLFDLEIADCAIHSGEIYYNDARIPLDAELHDLRFDAAYSLLTSQYKGSLSYDDGRLASNPMRSIPHAMQLQFAADRSGISFRSLVLTSGASRISLNARLTNYSSPSIDGTYEGNVATAELAKELRIVDLPEGNAAFHGALSYAYDPKNSFLSTLGLKGKVSSARLRFPGNRKPIDAVSVSAGYTLRNGNLQIDNLIAGILGGSIRAAWAMQHVEASNASSRLDASLKGISLALASDAFAPRQMRNIPLQGAADLQLGASWSGSVSNAAAHARLAISSRQGAISSRGIPINGLVQFDYDGPRNTVVFAPSHLQTTNTKLVVSGTLRPRRGNSVLTVNVTTADLSEVGMLATIVQSALAPPNGKSAVPGIPVMNGSAALNANVTGTAKDPRIQANLTARNLIVDGRSWPSLALRGTASSNSISIENATLAGTGHELLSLNGKAGLRAWSIAPNSAIQLQGSAAGIPVAQVESIVRLQLPITGTLSGKVSVHGTRQNPEGDATITIANGAAWDEPLQALTVHAQSHGGSIHSMLEMRVPAGRITADASYELAMQRFDLKFQGSDLNLSKIRSMQKRASVAGVATVSAAGSGTLKEPRLNAEISIPSLLTQGQTFSNIEVRIGVANQQANLELHTVVAQGSVEAKGDVQLTGNHYITSALDIQQLPVAAVAAALFSQPPPDLGGQTEIHVTLDGPLSTPADMEAHLRIPTLEITYGKDQISLVRPLEADYRKGIVTLAPAQIQGLGTNLTFGGTIPIQKEASYSIAADGTLDLSILHKFSPGVRSSGQVNIHLSGHGESARPDIQGQLQIKNAVLSADSMPVGLEGLNAQLNISGNRADIANLSGTAGGGSVSGRGFVSIGRDGNFDLVLNAQSVRIRYPEGLRSIVSGQLNLQGNPGDSTLSGRVLVNNLSLTQQFDLANFAGSFSQDSGGASASTLENNMKLRVAVQSAQDINLANSKLSIGGSANLNVMGTVAQPVLLGRISLTSGDVFFLGKRFEVQSGTIDFANPVRTDPVLRMYVTTTIEQYDITLNLSGPVERLSTNYTSDPALPPVDIIHLLAFGNTNAESASQPTQSATMGAESVLAQGVSSQVAGKLENLTGISQLTIDPLATNSQGNTGTQIGIQERITGSLLFTFSTDVTSTQSQTVELQYDLNKRWSVTALRDQNGGYGLNLRLHKTF